MLYPVDDQNARTRKMNDKAEDSSQLTHILPDHWLDLDAKLHFKFEGLAKTLAELAWNPANDTPFTVVVRGGWGRGKTTLMRHTQAMLRGKKIPKGARDVRTLWFNAWKYPNDDSVLAGLLGELLAEFQRGGLINQLKGFLERNKGTLIRRLLRAAAPWLPHETELGIEFDATPVSVAEYSLIEEKRAFHDTFRDLFARLSHLLLFSKDLVRDKRNISEAEIWPTKHQKECSLAIFLDDLDRCPDKRVLETMEAINLFLDLPGVCFYLGLDWERLGHILHKRFGERTDEFLEKIVQISLELPEVNEQDAGNYITELVNRNPVLQETLGAKDARNVAGILTSRHPRHIKRFLNDLSMRLAVLKNTNHLGHESPQLPPAAVVAWHLLHEALPEFAHKTAKLRANLDAFLRNWAEDHEKLEKGKTPKALEENLREVHKQGRLDRFITRLDNLTLEQREALVHFGSPPEDQVKTISGKASPSRAGKIDWVEISAGEFKMGIESWADSKPVHDVQIANDFFIAKHPITNAQYKEYVDASNAEPPKHWDGYEIPEAKEDHPVVYVSRSDAVVYCDWLNQQYKGKDGLQIRLPTEAEWEYVASGINREKRRYPWGDDEPIDTLANFASTEGEGTTTPVNGYPKGATPEGVLDMAGNVWELCLDFYGGDFYKASPKQNPVNLKNRSTCVLRGGSFNHVPDFRQAAYREANYLGFLQAAYRFRGSPVDRSDNVGFRVVLSPFSPSDR